MGSDYMFQQRDQDEARSRFASKLANKIDAKILYRDIPSLPEEFEQFYTGEMEFTDNKGMVHRIQINYNNAVTLYKFIKMIKKELS